VNSQPFGQGAADEGGRIIQVNRNLCEMLGYDVKALLARDIRDITHHEDWAETGQKLQRILQADEPFTIVKRYVRADASVVWVQTYVSLMHDGEGRTTLSALMRPVLPVIGEAQRWGGEKPIPLAQSELRQLMTPRLGPRGIIH